MKTKIQKYILCAWCLLPLILTVSAVFYFDGLYEKSMMKIVRRQYYEKIELTSSLLLEIEKLHRGYEKDAFEKDVLFNDFIIRSVEEIDRQYGIYARVIDLEGNLLSRPQLADNEPGLAVFLESEDFDFKKDLGFVQDIPTGDRHIVSNNGVKIHLHWLRYPVTEQHYCYILLGIVYDRVIDAIDYRAFSIGLIIVLLVLVSSLFYTVHLLNRNFKLQNNSDDRS